MLQLWDALLHFIHMATIPPKKWTGSLDGKRLVAITEFKKGIDLLDQSVWLEFQFQGQEGSQGHTLRAEYTIKGQETIILDGHAKSKPRIIVSHRIVGFSIRIVLEFEIAYNNGTRHRYRFDGAIPIFGITQNGGLILGEIEDATK